tara:strand:- start:494 stop:781 length:288 start_codon:yes stop_codon:yes gene_type:complete
MKVKSDRNRFVEGVNETWTCKDYYTFYMTIRRTDLDYDIKQGRNPNEYMLQTSAAEYFYGFKTPQEAMDKGYSRAKELYNMRIGYRKDRKSPIYE